MRRLATFLLLLLPTMPATAGGAGYRIDPSASEATFAVRLFWLEKVDGRFTQVTGRVAPGLQPDTWVVDASIPVDSVTMASPRMRQWALAPSFFDAEHHPLIHFVSDPIAQSALDQGGSLAGNLTLRGVTAPITFAVQPAHCGQQASVPCRIMLRGNLLRSTFGMTANRFALSDNVDLNLSITLEPESR